MLVDNTVNIVLCFGPRLELRPGPKAQADQLHKRGEGSP